LTYTIGLEGFDETYPEVQTLYREHYKEMCDRLAEQWIEMSPYNPRLDEYSKASKGGWLLTIIARHEGKAVGYCNVYITTDMHNQDLIAQEDTIFVTKAHRNGLGKELVKFGINELKSRGVKRLHVSAVTDLRVAKLWERMGFKHTAHAMTYTF
jgi:L-amino acid N-acyltransferase YncA